MKNLFCCLTLGLLVAAASPSWAGSPAEAVFKAKISGTVRTQILLGVSDGRIGTTSLNNKRVFDEFEVSPDDYELVLGLSSGASLALVPKSAASLLPTIVVFTVEDSQIVIDTKGHTIAVGGGLDSDATNLFEDLAGAVQGTVKFKGDFSGTPQFTKVTFDGHAIGTDQGGTGPALLTFKVSTGSVFVQGP